MGRTEEYVDLEVLLAASSLPPVPDQWDGPESLEFVENLHGYYDHDITRALTTTAEDLSAVTCIESIRLAAEERYDQDYDRLRRHGYEGVFSFAEIFNDIDKVMEVSRHDTDVKMTIPDAEALVRQAYQDAAVHAVIRKVAAGEETDIEAVKARLESTAVSDGAKVSIAKTFVEEIGAAIVATHQGRLPAEKQLHARQSLLMTDLAKVTIGHVAVTSESQPAQVVEFEQDFAFLQAVSREPVRKSDYDLKSRGRFTKKVAQLVINSTLAAFSIQPGSAAPAVISSAAEAVIKSSPISAVMADKLIEAISSEDQGLTAKVAIAKIVAPHEITDKRVAAANLNLLTQAVTDEITLTTGKPPATPEAIADDSPMVIYVMVADSVLEENARQLPDDHKELLTSYASFMKVVAANLDNLPEGLADVIIEQAQPGFVSTIRDLTLESISPDSTAEGDVLMATMYANLDAVLYPSASEQAKLLAEIKEEAEPAPTPPVAPPEPETSPTTPPAPRPPVETPQPPEENEDKRTPEQKAADKAFLDRVIDLHGQVVDDFWAPGKPVRPMDPTKLAEIINRLDAKYNHEAFGRKAALAQLFRESKFDNDAGSSAGAQGIAQFMPDTWEGLGKGGDVNDPEAAIDAQFRYMIGIYDKMKSHNPDMAPMDLLRLTFAGYNSGPNLDVYKRGQLPDYEETQTYVRVIFEIMEKTTARINDAVDILNMPEVPAGARDLGIHDGSKNGEPAKVRLVAIPGVPSSSSESTPGGDYYIDGANGELIVNVEIAANILQLVAEAKAAGFDLQVTSSFRTFQHQTDLWNQFGKDRERVAPPGSSLHESGKAIDWVLDNYANNLDAYPTRSGKWGAKASTPEDPKVAPNSKLWNWLIENAPRFGMWQYHREPWHWDPMREEDAKKAAEAVGEKLPPVEPIVTQSPEQAPAPESSPAQIPQSEPEPSPERTPSVSVSEPPQTDKSQADNAERVDERPNDKEEKTDEAGKGRSDNDKEDKDDGFLSPITDILDD